jgi:hypothetical protein
MALSPDLMAFVQTAVRLPAERLEQIDRAWRELYPHRTVVTDLVQSSAQLRQEVSALREYTLAEARRASAERPGERLTAEYIFEAVFPAARVVLLRRVLENSPDQWRAQAFAVLTAPFADILPRSRNGADRRGDR